MQNDDTVQSEHVEKPPRILMVTTSFPVTENPASGAFIKRMTDALKQQVDLHVLTPATAQPQPTHAGYRVDYFRYAPRKLQNLAHLPGGIPTALKRSRWNLLLFPCLIGAMFFSILRHGRNCDVIHANWGVTGLIASIAGSIIRKPTITTLRGSDVKGVRDSIASQFVTRLTITLSQRVTTVSHSISRELLSLWPQLKHKICVIPNGVADELLQIKHNTCEHSHLHLLTIGNLVSNKDVATILWAFSNLTLNASLTIVGNGDQRAMLESLCESLSITERVTFRGVISPDQVNSELKAADIFVLASHSEGRPNVVLEAMAAGCAVVATNLPCIRELIQHETEGLLFSPGDVSALTDNLARLCSDPALINTLGKRSQRKIMDEGMSWETCTRSYMKEYLLLLQH